MANNFRAPARPAHTPLERRAPRGDPPVKRPMPDKELISNRAQQAHNERRDGWYSLPGRSRFIAPTRARQVGHGVRLVSEGPAASVRDDTGGLTRFPVQRAPRFQRLAEWFQRNFRTTQLGSDDLREGYSSERRFYQEPVKYSEPQTMVNWTKAGPVPVALVRRIIPRRREFLSGAQHFRGQHTAVAKGARMAALTPRMRAAIQPRLTRYTPAPSFGSQTREL